MRLGSQTLEASLQIIGSLRLVAATENLRQYSGSQVLLPQVPGGHHFRLRL